MSANIVCLTSGGGLPIFSRKKGSCENLTFSAIGALNGIKMFGKPLDLEIVNTLSEDYSVVWKEFHDSVVFIVVASGCSPNILDKLLISAYNALVLIVGIEEVKSQKNVERLKRELRICYPIIDRLLDSLDCGDSSNKHSSDIIGYVETIICTENTLIQTVLDAFTECVESMYSCVLVSGKIAAATESWWSLHPEEVRLLSLLAAAENTSDSKDIPVYLPYRSPTVAFRFVSCTLMPDVQLCCLCGPTPVLNEIKVSANHCFKNSMDILNSALQCHPRNFPTNCVVDSGILGFLLVNTTYGKYVISKNPQQNSKKSGSSSHRLDILRTFFYQAVLSFLIPNKTSNENENTSESPAQSKSDSDDDNEGTETYWCSEYHKCHALKVGENILCVLYNSLTPTHAMRLVTEKTLKVLLADKQVYW